MGSYRSSLIVAPLLLALPAACPAAAQDGAQGDPIVNLPSATRQPSSDPRKQGPELDVYRDLPGTVQPATPPPLVVTPTITPTPSPVQTRPTPTPSTAAPQQSRPTRQSRPTPEPRRSETPQPAPAEPATPSPSEPIANTSALPETPVEDAAPAPSQNAAVSPPTLEQSPESSDDSSNWPWIVGALLLVAGLAAYGLMRRRKAAPEAFEVELVGTPSAPPAAPRATPPSLAPERKPEPVAPAPVAIDTDRPWIDMQLEITQARLSLLGVTIAYSLILHNRGERPAQDVLVRGVVGNAGPQQQAVLDAFFTGQTGMPLHSAVAIEPGETQRLSGELRLAPEEIAPVQMGERSLLIPIAAFDAAYRWGADEAADPQGHGRTARAFIVGQDQEPAADRLAPLRVDQGFRQYRRPAARAAAELTPS